MEERLQALISNSGRLLVFVSVETADSRPPVVGEQSTDYQNNNSISMESSSLIGSMVHKSEFANHNYQQGYRDVPQQSYEEDESQTLVDDGNDPYVPTTSSAYQPLMVDEDDGVEILEEEDYHQQISGDEFVSENSLILDGTDRLNSSRYFGQDVEAQQPLQRRRSYMSSFAPSRLPNGNIFCNI